MLVAEERSGLLPLKFFRLPALSYAVKHCWKEGFRRANSPVLPQFVLQELQQIADAAKIKSACGDGGAGDSQSDQEAYPERIL